MWAMAARLLELVLSGHSGNDDMTWQMFTALDWFR